MRNITGKTGKTAKRKRPRDVAYHAANYLRNDAERAAYLGALLEERDAHVLTIGLRELTESAGGMAVLAKKTGLSRETLYRTLSPRGNPRLDTVNILLAAFGLRMTIRPAKAA